MDGLQPVMRDPLLKRSRPVRHVAWSAFYGTNAPHGLACKFGTYGCVCPRHLEQQSHSDSIKKGLAMSPQGKALQKKKLQVQLPPEAVQDILQRNIKQSEYARKYGCSKRTIAAIQSQKTHAANNVFAALFHLGERNAKSTSQHQKTA